MFWKHTWLCHQWVSFPLFGLAGGGGCSFMQLIRETFSDKVRVEQRSKRKEVVRLIVLWQKNVPGKETIKYQDGDVGPCLAYSRNNREPQSSVGWSRVSMEESRVGDKVINTGMPDQVTSDAIIQLWILRHWKNFNRELTSSDIKGSFWLVFEIQFYWIKIEANEEETVVIQVRDDTGQEQHDRG